jgi:hypothetical protein
MHFKCKKNKFRSQSEGTVIHRANPPLFNEATQILLFKGMHVFLFQILLD